MFTKPADLAADRISIQGQRFAGLPVAFDDQAQAPGAGDQPTIGTRMIDLARKATALHLELLEARGDVTAFTAGWDERGGGA